MTDILPGIPSKAEAFARLNRLLAASSPTRRTPQQDLDIARAWEVCDHAKFKEYLEGVRRCG